jgi:hypothetical protein
MAVQYQFHAKFSQKRVQGVRIGQTFAPTDCPESWWMVDQHDSIVVPTSRLRQDFSQTIQLDFADTAYSQVGCAGLSRANTDQGHTAPDSQAWENLVQIIHDTVFIP